MRYSVTVNNNYIVAIGTGEGGKEITEEEYNGIYAVIKAMPKALDGYGYKLRTDLIWEEYQTEQQLRQASH